MPELSGFEKYFYFRSKLDIHSCFFIGIQLNEIPASRTLSFALRQAIAKFPELHSNVTVDKKPAIVSIRGPLQFEDVVVETEYQTVGQEETNEIFDKVSFEYGVDRPLWKILVVRHSNQLLLCMDHVLFDGISGVNIWTEILNELNSSNIQPGATERIVFNGESAAPSVRSHPYAQFAMPLVWKLKYWFVLALSYSDSFYHALHGTSAGQIQFPKYKMQGGLLSETQKIRNDNCRFKVSLTPVELQAVQQKCRDENVSLTCCLAAMLSAALNHVDVSSRQGTTVKVDIPINTRPLLAETLNLDPSDIKVGNFVKPAELKFELNQGTVDRWATARTFAAQLKKERRNLDPLYAVKLMDALDVAKYIETQKKTEYPAGTFEITNVGLQSFGTSPEDKFQVIDALFDEPQGLSDVFTLATVSTPTGGLNCSLSYPQVLSNDLRPAFEAFYNELKGLI
ncbi:LAMI_0G02806g1_1 [Lachancea mirantina]|uniref:LAMI_0G02806g1_1 n=1 Tax=Lachancea mirantina TaxID=1230905 RepID=A0A1G4K7V9_9SACH|nr:LAMI_0G02806g1_1 [Lachancea mirantina]